MTDSKSNARAWHRSAKHLLYGTRRAPLPMLEMMKPRWSGRVCVGVSKQPLSVGVTDDARSEKRVLDYLSSPCCFLEGVAGEQIVDIKQRDDAVAVEHCWYYRLVQILGELVQPSGKAGWENSTT